MHTGHCGQSNYFPRPHWGCWCMRRHPLPFHREEHATHFCSKEGKKRKKKARQEVVQELGTPTNKIRVVMWYYVKYTVPYMHIPHYTVQSIDNTFLDGWLWSNLRKRMTFLAAYVDPEWREAKAACETQALIKLKKAVLDTRARNACMHVTHKWWCMQWQ
jgi:hypothetical protein